MKKAASSPLGVPSRRGPLDRRTIASSALELIDAEGLDNLSMRRLGAALGVEAMAIYHYFANKGELLDAIVDLFIDEIEPVLSTPAEPLDRLRACFAAVRGIAITHPRAFWVLPARRFRTDRALRFYDRLLQTFHDAGFDAALSARYYRLAVGFAIGAGMAEIGSRAQQPDPTPVVLEDLDDAENFPFVSQVVPHLRVANLDSVFEFGMDRIFEAMRRSLEGPKSVKSRGTQRTAIRKTRSVGRTGKQY
jgi:TetR/AcrR family transcriptional regulator, tetracycline repressor protein